MTDSKKTFKPAAMKKEGIAITGVVKFSNLREGSRPKTVPDAPLNYNLVLTFPEDDPQVMMIEEMTKEAIEMEKALIPAVKRRDVQPSLSPLKTDVDADNNATGMLKLNLKKLAVTKNGQTRVPPEILNEKGHPVDLAFIRAGSVVTAQVSASSYNIANKAGLSFKLERVKIVEEAPAKEGSGEYTSKSIFGSPVDEEAMDEDSVL